MGNEHPSVQWSEPPGAVILCGGRGRRMGQDKGAIRVDGRTMLERVVEIVAGFAAPVVLAARPGQILPELPGRVSVVTDQRLDAGPLEGVRVGLEALVRYAVAGRTPSTAAEAHPADPGWRSSSSAATDRVGIACVCACDQPLIRAALFGILARHLTPGVAGVIPSIAGRLHPLTALYRPRLAPAVERLLESGQRRAAALADLPGVKVVTEHDEAGLLPLHRAFANVNAPEDLREIERELRCAGDG